MMIRAASLLGVLGVLGLVGCNPTGTCMQGDPSSEFEPTCTLQMPRRACEGMTHSEFFEETRAAGLVRCRGLGYETRPGGGEDLLFLRR